MSWQDWELPLKLEGELVSVWNEGGFVGPL
jgi:hypothetical protein